MHAERNKALCMSIVRGFLVLGLLYIFALDSSRAAAGPLYQEDQSPIIGAALSVLADGAEPWEDRPIVVAGLGTIPGQRNHADPGDDLGPRDGIVRSWDSVLYRASLSVREGRAEEVRAELLLPDLLRWDRAQLDALKLGACPEGAELLDGGRRLRCNVGSVQTPPAVTIALDVIARVSPNALQGDVFRAQLQVTSANAAPDPEDANCPKALAHGCEAISPELSVSAAPAAELRKRLAGSSSFRHAGVAGRRFRWQLDLLQGADSDIRGSSNLSDGPWVLPDWWTRVLDGRAVSSPVHLIGCSADGPAVKWSCAQPGGPGNSVEVTIESIAAMTTPAQGLSSLGARRVGSLTVDLWFDDAELKAKGGDLSFKNCFGLAPGRTDIAIWSPHDARGLPNLGGRAEPAANNCSHIVVPYIKPRPTSGPPRIPVPPVPSPRRPGIPAPPPTPLPRAELSKNYRPVRQGDAVVAGSEFSAIVDIKLIGRGTMPGVILCDKWDNSTQTLRDAGFKGARASMLDARGQEMPIAEDIHYVLEFSAGYWGAQDRSVVSDERGWYLQSVSGCEDTHADLAAGWLAAEDVDFENKGRKKVDAKDLNMSRLRIIRSAPVPSRFRLETFLKAGERRPGTWLMNHAAGHWGSGRSSDLSTRAGWRRSACYGRVGTGSRALCPKPAPGTRGRPGRYGDMLVMADVPLLITKRSDPSPAGASPVVEAGKTIDFVLAASTFAHPSAPPLPSMPAEARAEGVVISDTLPYGLSYVLDSARVASEDLNANGELDPGEDLNGNGRIDLDQAFAPEIGLGTEPGSTTLFWRIGDVENAKRLPEIRYRTQVSRLMRGGAVLDNQAGIWSREMGRPDCRPAHRNRFKGRCAWAQIIVANIAAAQVEKRPLLPLVLPGEDLVYHLALASLTALPVEHFDAVDLLPRIGEPRDPESQFSSGFDQISARILPSVLPNAAPIAVWASAQDPETLDTKAGGLRDGLIDPVETWGSAGAGLGSSDWPCLLRDVGSSRRCPQIDAMHKVTALRIWGADPDPLRSGGPRQSFLPPGHPPREIELRLSVPNSKVGDLYHNAWGGRFESLPLPVFDGAIIRVRPPDTATPTPSHTPTQTPSPTATRLPSITPFPTLTPSPTNTPTASHTPTQTPSPTPTFTPSQVPSATPTPSPTPWPYSIYLPLVPRTSCGQSSVDVVLVVDVSSSMRRPAGDGGSKQDAVMRAARSFVDAFDMRRDRGRIAIVAFNDRAQVVQTLTNSRPTIDAAIDRLPSLVAEGTRLDLGLLKGRSVLAGRPEGRLRAMVFLTDGLPNRVPTPVSGGLQEDTVLAAAKRVRAEGITIHTVGYGREDAPELVDRILPWLLRDIAGPAGRYHETADAGHLAVLFRHIALDLICSFEEKDEYWP